MRISDWSSDVCSSDLFTFANANIARGDVRVGTDVQIKLGHEALAKTHDFIIRFIPRVEIGATFARPQWKPRKTILECLLKSKELQYTEVNRGGESQPAFIGP